MTRLHDDNRRDFASDNYAGVHPEVLEALADANGGHVPAYGDDPYTAALRDRMAEIFGAGTETFPVSNGTGANVIALQAALPRWGAVVCAETAHVNTDESVAPQSVAGLKLLPTPTPDGKLTPALVAQHAWGWGDEHHAQPGVVSITQSTELGTVYAPDEISALTAYAHERGMLVHVDGARLANAAASLGQPLRAFTTDVGVDLLSFGGTKNGLLAAEAVVVLPPAASASATAATSGPTSGPTSAPTSAPTSTSGRASTRGSVVAALPYLRKLDLQLTSKMRFVSAQLLALLDDDLWLRSARHANAMAQRLADQVSVLPRVQLVHPVQANGVFVRLEAGLADELRREFRFYDWDQAGQVRWMCAFDTTADDVDRLAEAVSRVSERR